MNPTDPAKINRAIESLTFRVLIEGVLEFGHGLETLDRGIHVASVAQVLQSGRHGQGRLDLGIVHVLDELCLFDGLRGDILLFGAHEQERGPILEALEHVGAPSAVVLDGGALEHDLLPMGLDPGQGENLGLEHQRLLVRVDHHVRKQLLAPFDLH